MSLKKFLFSKVFFKNLLFAILIIALVLIITMWGLKIYTKHDKAFALPDLSGLTEIELSKAAKEYKIKLQILDSAYIKNAAPGTVIDQIPVPGFKVKENRTVFLTINAHSPEQVILPKLRDVSFRQATVLIENSGLAVGEIAHKPSEYVDLVLDVFIDSTLVYEGDRFPKDSEIGLVVGKSSINEKTQVPDIIGYGLEEAKAAITNAMLNVGVVIYDETILDGADSINAKVYRQRPDPRINSKIELGTSIDLWMTIDQLKINDAY